MRWRGLLGSGVVLAALAVAFPTVSTGATTTPLSASASFGAFVPGMAWQPALLDELENTVGRDASVASYFAAVDDPFPGPADVTLSEHGRRSVLIAWDMGDGRFTDWTSGRNDPVLKALGARAAAYPYPLFLRPWAEMNGDWQPYQPTPDGSLSAGGTPAEFVAAWRYVVSKVRAYGGTNVQWVFCVDADLRPTMTDPRTIWPGEAYVDVMAMDGYNWGKDSSWGTWREFEEIFAGMYDVLATLDPVKPIWIAETGSKEPSVDDGAPVDGLHDKASWVRRAYASTLFPRVSTVVWFDTRKERDWRINSSPAALDAMRAALVVPRTLPDVSTLSTNAPRGHAPDSPLRTRRHVGLSAERLDRTTARARWTVRSKVGRPLDLVVQVRSEKGDRWREVKRLDGSVRRSRGKVSLSSTHHQGQLRLQAIGIDGGVVWQTSAVPIR